MGSRASEAQRSFLPLLRGSCPPCLHRATAWTGPSEPALCPVMRCDLPLSLLKTDRVYMPILSPDHGDILVITDGLLVS